MDESLPSKPLGSSDPKVPSSPTAWSAPIAANLARVRTRIEQAEAAAGRAPGSTRLLPITKGRPLAALQALLDLGEGALGENRAGELIEKDEALRARGLQPEWHFIGPLQRNKARRVIERITVLHSVHSLALLGTLDRLTQEMGRPLGIYLQLALTGERAKQGFSLEETGEALDLAGKRRTCRCLDSWAWAPKTIPNCVRPARFLQLCRGWPLG